MKKEKNQLFTNHSGISSRRLDLTRRRGLSCWLNLLLLTPADALLHSMVRP